MSRTAVASSRDILIPQAEGEALFNDTLSLPQRKQAGCSFCTSEESGKEKGAISSLPTVWGTWGSSPEMARGEFVKNTFVFPQP